MANRHSNLIFGSSITLAVAVLGLSAYHHLRTIRAETRITKPSPSRSSPDLISQRTEDAINVDTLGALYDSPNWDIRQAAVKLVVERVLRSDAYPLLLTQIRSPKRDVHTPALHTLRFLATSSPVPLPAPAVDTCAAVVAFLACKNRAAARRAHTPDTDWKSRTPGEQHALVALEALCVARLPDALKAGLVSQWLAHYPFGGPDADMARRRAVVRKVTAHQTDDDRLASILIVISYDADGRKQMRVAGLIGSVIEEKEHGGWPGDDDHSDYTPHRDRRRQHDESEGEMATRRRRRQAMVFSEGGPVTRDNIYENESVMTPGW